MPSKARLSARQLGGGRLGSNLAHDREFAPCDALRPRSCARGLRLYEGAERAADFCSVPSARFAAERK